MTTTMTQTTKARAHECWTCCTRQHRSGTCRPDKRTCDPRGSFGPMPDCVALGHDVRLQVAPGQRRPKPAPQVIAECCECWTCGQENGRGCTLSIFEGNRHRGMGHDVREVGK
jgi:hypothetical protein